MAKPKPMAIEAKTETVEDLQTALAQANAEIANLQGLLDAALAGPGKSGSANAGKGTHALVTSSHPSGGHYRAGRKWSRAQEEVDLSTLTPEQIEALKADRHIVFITL